MCNEKKEMKKLVNEGCGGKSGVSVNGERREGGEGRGAAFPRADGAVGRRCRYRRRLSELARRL